MSKLKILGVETKFIEPTTGEKRTGAVDWWRVINPLTHLKKITDWEIEIRKGVGDDEEVRANPDKVWSEVGQNFNVVFSSYHANPLAFSYIKVLEKKYGLKYVMDLDDNLFNIKEYNPVYEEYTKKINLYKTILSETKFITVTNGRLKKKSTLPIILNLPQLSMP